MLDLRQGRKPSVHTLVDVSAIPELTTLEVRGEELWIGAAVPLRQVVHSQLVHLHAQALAEACDLIGGPQVRNVATLGGNVAHALPAADGAIALLALDAYALVASLETESAEAFTMSQVPEVILTKGPLLDLYLGPGKTALTACQLLVGFYLPLAGPGQGSAFTRVMRSQGVALPVLNLAVGLKRQQDTIEDLHIAIGPAGPIPLRAFQAESVLRGRPLTPENLAAAETCLRTEAHFRTSPQRATAEYRQHLAGKILSEAVYKAWERVV
jgi:xanthine dehydrogenase FAD-binding subunit